VTADSTLVRGGYEEMAGKYLAQRTMDSPDVRLLDDFAALVPGGSTVLDAGCGSGRPVAEYLAERYSVTGLDFAASQLLLARESVPSLIPVLGDMSRLPFAAGSFAGVVSYYAIIHVPRELHSSIYGEVFRVLAPGGVALVCTGANDLPVWREDYLGAPMFWSHFDRATNLALFKDAGFETLREQVLADATSGGDSGHLFALLRKP
jgi:SAM-dependent methyltransferase